MSTAPKKGEHSPEPPPALHELEAEVMEYIWQAGESSVRTVMQALNNAGATDRAYTTYMTVMARLDRKQLLARRREGKTDYYSALLDREGYMTQRAQAGVDDLVSQYGDVALTHFARQIAGLDPARRRALQRLARND